MCFIPGMIKTGTLQALNASPKGFYEGFLLKTGEGVVQINLGKDESETLGNLLVLGEEITAEVTSEEPHGKPEHDVFLLIRIHGKNQAPELDPQKGYPFSGKIERLNYSRGGEVNGGMLHSGDFVHLRPQGARSIGLKIGMQVDGRGRTKPMVGGHMVIEPNEINGVVVHHHKLHPTKHATKHAAH